MLFGSAPAASAEDPSGDSSFPTEGSHVTSVVVTARKLPVRNAIDRKVYSVSEDIQSTFGTIADVLSAIPSVVIDPNGAVSLRGDTSVLILVDGQPLAQVSSALAGDALQQIPAEDIERIEVITNPPAQFKANGSAGVINIITRKERPPGLSGTARATVGNRGRYVGGASSDFHSGKLNLTASATVRRDDKRRRITSDTAVPDLAANEVVLGHTHVDDDLRRLIPVGKIALDYAFTKSRSLTLSVSGGSRTGDRSVDEFHSSSVASGPLLSESERHTEGLESSHHSDQRVVFTQKFHRPGETLDLVLHRTTAYERQSNLYTNFTITPPANPAQDDLHLSENQVISDFGVDYAVPFTKSRILKLGYSAEEHEVIYAESGANIDPATGMITSKPGSVDNFRYRQRLHAAYATYQAGVGPWTWLAGVRVERALSRTHQLANDFSIDRTGMRVYPSLHVERPLSDDATLGFSASRRVSWPSAGDLNPYIDRQNSHNLRAGNPYLVPQDTQSYETAYSVDAGRLSYSVTGYFRRNRNALTDVTQFLSPDVALTTKENLPRSRSMGLEFAVNQQLSPLFAYGLSGNLFRAEIDATALGTPGLKSTTSFDAKANLDYHPTSADTLQVAVNRSGKRLTPQGSVDAINQVNLAYRRQIARHLAAVATVTDLMDKQVFHRTLSTPAFTSDYRREVVGRRMYVGLVYSFGSAKRQKAEASDDAN